MSKKKPFISPLLKAEFRDQLKVVFGSKRYLFHFLFWMLAIVFIIADVKDFSEGFNVGITVADSHATKTTYNSLNKIQYVLIGAFGLSMAYLFLLIIIPYARYKHKKRYLYLGFIAFIFLMTITIIIGMSYYLGYNSGPVGDAHARQAGYNIGIILTLSLSTTGLFFTFYYFKELYDQQRNLNRFHEIFTQKTLAETSFLKTQINPHFLFNTLNNIYALTLQQSDKAVAITTQLRDLCAYMLEDCNKDMVSLEGEVNFIRSYIILEQLRNKEENVKIDLEINGNFEGKEIAPLLLINFIENAFKHGVKSGVDKASVLIRLYVIDNILTFEMRNSKQLAEKSFKNKGVIHAGGIGLKNVKRRLALLYPDKYKLRISDSNLDYSVYLNLNLN